MSSEAPIGVTGTAYLKSIQGVCKIVEIVFDIIGVALVVTDFYGYAINIFRSASIISIIFSACFLLRHLFSSTRTLSYYKLEIVIHILICAYYLTGIVLILKYGDMWDQLVAGAAMGIVSVIAHLVDGVDNFRKMRAS